MSLTGNLVFYALLIAIVGAAALPYCGLRLYASLKASSLGRRLRKSDPEARQDGESAFHEGFLKELVASGRMLAGSLIAALALIIVIRLFGLRAEREACVRLLQAFQIAACALFVLSQACRTWISAALPSGVGFR